MLVSLAALTYSLTFLQEHKIRATMVKILEEKFKEFNLNFAIGGEISFDVFPKVCSFRTVRNLVKPPFTVALVLKLG